ncbi:hypothetical protein [Sporosarcina sp. G11-34]|nr:hypothetical protein [Sporosarcina sp. G11-34]MCZ2259189.1 hypothetical protein [Sporosarcina sp. G11-34]
MKFTKGEELTISPIEWRMPGKVLTFGVKGWTSGKRADNKSDRVENPG